MIKTLSRLFRRQATGPVTTKQRWLKLRYDAAQTTLKNQQHWSYSDNFGPRNANSADVRRVLRSRSRYEAYESNPYLRGMILTLVNDTIGKGPRLQITDERIEPARRRFLETRWQEWVDASRFRQKLWQLRLAKLIDGEAFLAAGNNPALGLPIELDWRFIEADQVSSPFASPGDTPREVDGIRLDGFGNPTSYYVLDQHPGDGWTGFAGREGRWLPSRFIVHWFRQERGSFRAVPETTASLPMCAILRRYTLAVLQAAETAASFAAVLESDGPPNTDPWTNPDTGETTDPAWETMPIESGQFLMLPWRYSVTSLDRCCATAMKPSISKTGSSTPGSGEANSTNSKPSRGSAPTSRRTTTKPNSTPSAS